jgi:glucosamine--fructose-6-phosphate aminotransferase (isomerizing)
MIYKQIYYKNNIILSSIIIKKINYKIYMCGICGYIGHDNSFSNGYLGILKLLNRGYDSVGITTINKNQKFITHKYASDDKELADIKILKHQNEHDGNISILHSRWRTVGDKTDANSHPHLDMTNTFSLVHNGIIENYIELKKFLIENGYTFRSETDSEVIVNLISYHYVKNSSSSDINPNHNNVIKAINNALSDIEGTYALCILCIDTPESLYCVRHGSPLLVGISDDMLTAMVVSESYAFNSKINKYLSLKNSDIIILKKENNKITMSSNSNTNYEHKIFKSQIESHSPDPYPHWTLKEINEQVISCNNATNNGGRIIDDYNVMLGGLSDHKPKILACDNLILLGCGTSYHAGLLSLKIYKNLCNNFKIIQLFDGSEFTSNDIPKFGKTCAIFISQSGETKDLHRCLEICNNNDIVTIGVINVVDSLIAREVNCGVYLNCGREFAVASTKAFSSQIVVLTLIGIWFAQNFQNSIENKEKRKSYISKTLNLGNDIKNVIINNMNKCKNIANFLYTKNSMFILGKDTMESIAKEGALKLKEIGYIHAEGYSSSALKHGPYALLDLDFPVILLTPNDEHFVRNQGILDELKSRGSYVIGISDVELNDKYDQKILVPKNSYLEITFCVVLQLVAYFLSIKKEINPDFPRNLSKTVSVD